MRFRVEVVCLQEGDEQRCNVLEMERTELATETLGLSVAEGKAMLHGVQDFMAAQQVIADSIASVRVQPAANAVTVKRSAPIPSRRYSGRSRCPVRGGIAAPTRRKGRAHFVLRLRGCKESRLVRSCSIWKRSGPH
jgi:hypothetical protein